MRTHLLLERFISRDRRNEPPDIDVDFEHQRREEVIQYIYAKYGRERAAIAAVVICYRPRSALRDVGKALEIPEALVAAMSKEHPGMYSREVLAERLQRAPLSGSSRSRLRALCRPPIFGWRSGWTLATQLQRFPRHLSQHVGGFVLTQGPLTRLVPVENAAMEDRSIIQWDKDDLDAVGLMKVDVLALGMLSCHTPLPGPGQRSGAARRLRCRTFRGRPRHLRHDLPGRHRGRVPDREPGADEHAAAPATPLLLRPGGAGGHRAARPDSGRHGAPVSEGARQPGSRCVYASPHLQRSA